MGDNICIESKFESLLTFSSKKYDLFIKNINFQDRIADCELLIEGTLLKVKSNLKFTSILPIISRVEISIDSSTFYDLEFERFYEEHANLTVLQDTNRLIDRKSLVEKILNMDDSLGGKNLYVYLPSFVQNKIFPSSIIKVKFSYAFYFETNNFSPHIDFSYYSDVFYTPSDFNSPSGGYKPCIWMPCNNRTLDSVIWDVRVNVPSSMLCVCTGNLIDVTDSYTPFSKIWNFQVRNPTNPGNIFVSIGYFETAETCENVVGYALKDLCSFIPRTIDYIPNYNFKILDKLHVVFLSRVSGSRVFGNVFVVPTTILTTRDNLMQRHKNYRVFARVLCEYIFGTCVMPRTIADLWLICSLNRYIYFEFIKIYFGRCEFSRYYNKEQKRACECPSSSNEHVFYLSPHMFLVNGLSETISVSGALNFWYASSHPYLLATKRLWRCFTARCGLTIVSIENSITNNHLNKVISNMLSVISTQNVDQMRPSTEYFFDCLLNTSGKDIFAQTCRNWLSVSRPLYLTVDYAFNRRKSCLEVSILNEDYEIEINIPVTISITVQEYDGAFEHTYQIQRDSRRSTYEIPTQSSRWRRTNARKKVLAENGRELDIDFLQAFKSPEQTFTSDNPVLYIRINRELCTFFGRVRVDQPDISWYYQAYLESTPLGHLKAVKTLKSYPSDIAIFILTKVIKNNSCWYFVRAAAFISLIYVFNKLRNEEIARIDKEQNPLDIYKSIFGYVNYNDMPKINDFSNIPMYYLQMSFIQAISNLRMIIIKDNTKTRRMLGYEILRTIYEYNDNVSNMFDDCCYRAHLLIKLGISLTHIQLEMLPEALKFVLRESLYLLKEDHLSKYVHGCLAFAALSNIFLLQKMKYIEMDERIFIYCCSPGVELRLRIMVIDLLVQYILISQSFDVYKFVLDLIMFDPAYSVRFSCVYALKRHPLFQAKHPESLNSKINTEQCHTYLYNVIETLSEEPDSFILYSELSEFYNIIYGEGYHLPVQEEDEFRIAEAKTELKSDGTLKFIIGSG